MNKLNKQLKSIIESTEKFIINDELFEEQKQVLVSQIKQSILKAIMESDEPRLYDENSDSYYINLSVIKEVLQTKTNEKD